MAATPGWNNCCWSDPGGVVIDSVSHDIEGTYVRLLESLD